MIRLVFLLLGLGLMLPLSAEAKTRALLVGAFDYDQSIGISDLKGPVNDIRLIQDMLDKRGIQDIRILSDILPPDQKATRANILAALAKLAEDSEKGDLAYIHMSGHGSRQPDQNHDETDGLDEIFLPSDIGKAEPGSQTVPNAILDEELGAALTKIRQKGADVWFVLDSCHSGSGMRAGEGHSLDRKVDPAVLGISIQESAASAADSEPSDRLGTDQASDDSQMGGILAFYAARSTEVAKEVDLSGGKADDQSGWYGLFTSALVSRMERNPNLTYRQLFQAVLSDINNNSALGVARLQTPSWEGTMIDRPLLGGKGGNQIQRYLVTGDQLEAGLVHGVRVGTLIGLVGADLTDNNFLSFAQVEEVESRRAYLRQVAESCEPNADDLCPPSGSLPEEARFAQIAAQPTDQTIHFSPILSAQTGERLADDHPLQALLTQSLTEAKAQTGLAAEPSADPYDVQIVLRDGSLWFGPQSTIGDQPVGLAYVVPDSLPAAAEPRLTRLLSRIIRAETFAKTMDALEADAGMADQPLDISAKLVSSAKDKLAPVGSSQNPQRECRAALRGMKLKEGRPLEPDEALKQCDYLDFRVEGAATEGTDVNRIHIDSHYCIHSDYELVEGKSEDRQVGAPLVICSDCPAPINYSAGFERVYVLASQTEQNKESLNLTGLVDNCFPEDFEMAGTKAGTGSRSIRTSRSLKQGLKAITGKAANARSAMSLGGGLSDIWVSKFRWRTLPKQMVLGSATEKP